MDHASDEHRVAVLVVNWNTSDLLHACLDSLHQLPEAAELEVVVIDNGSADDSVAMVRSEFPNVDLIENDANEGFARANNLGVARSTSPYILLLNSDTVVRPHAIARCRDHLRDHPGVGVVGCRIENADGSAQNSVFRYPSLRGVASTTLGLSQAFPESELFNHERYANDQPEETAAVEVVMGSFLMVRRADFETEPVLDDGYFMYAEEADLCRRVRMRGQRVDFIPTPGATHVAGASSRTPAQRAWSDEAKKRAKLKFVRKWDGPLAAYCTNIVMLGGMLPRLFSWAVLDLLDSVRGRSPGRTKKAHALRFHVTGLYRPSVFSERFHAPPGEGS